MPYVQRRRFLLTLFMVAAMLSVDALVAASANASPPCSWASCNGLDPHAMGCDVGASTMDEFTYSAYFELRYSSTCHAVWTRVTSQVDYNTIFGQVRAYQTYPTSLNSPTYLVYGVQARAGTYWTAMVSYGYWVRSCASSWFNAVPIACTAVH